MKKTITLLLSMFLLSSFAISEELKWYNWNEGYEIAKKENKTMLIFVQTDWCHQCKRLNDKTFNHEEVIPLINKDFVPVKFDIEADEKYLFEDKELNGFEILSSISKEDVRGIPTTILWNPGKKKVKPVVGLKDPGEMKGILSYGQKKKR